MALFAEQRTALAHAFDDTDLHVYDNETPRIEYPALIIGWPESYDPRAYLGGGADIVFPCRLELPASRDWESADDQLEGYLSLTGPNSLIAAIEADPTLGGVVDSAAVIGFDNFGFREMNNAGNTTVVLMCEARIEVYA